MTITDVNENLTEVSDSAGNPTHRVEKHWQDDTWNMYALEPVGEGVESTETHVWAEKGSFATKTEALSAATA